MLKGLHNRLGENGQALTVLSLLEGPEFVGPREDVSGSLSEVSLRLREMAGGNDTELVSMFSVYPNENGSLEFLALERVPLAQAISRINEINGRGSGGGAHTLLRVVDRADADDDTEGSDDGLDDGLADGHVNQAVARLRDALRGLFNRAGENGQPLTVLSLLSGPDGAPKPE
jgi:hypothetical protein